MPAIIERVTVLCFGASYLLALILELLHLFRPRPILRLLSLVLGIAGLFRHSVFLLVQQPSLTSSFGSLLFLAWILAVFYLYGSLHHHRLAWAVFVLPLVLGLVGLATLFPRDGGGPETSWLDVFRGERFWVMAHLGLVLLASVGICVAFVASVMYLVQVQRLKAKLAPGQGVRLLSLERLEAMNRRALLWSFPLLTAGLIVGMILQIQGGNLLTGWTSPKILRAIGLWLVFAILLYLRFAAHVRGRRVALWTVAAFALLLLALLSPVHPFAQGGGP